MLFALEKGNLCPEQAFDGHIHSVFMKAINIVSDGPSAAWVSLLDLSLPNTPCGLKVPLATQPLFRQCLAGDKVYFRGGILRFDSQPLLSIDTRSATLWRIPPAPMKYDKQRFINNIRYAENCFSQYINESVFFDLCVDDYLGYLKVIDISCDFDLFNYPSLIANNVGKGHGLTPSGDDFICGVFALLFYVSRSDFTAKQACLNVLQVMATACDSKSQATTDVSRHYLQQASNGHFSQPVLWLVYSIFNATSGVEVARALNNVLEIGSSSGADIISGILFGAHQLQLGKC